MTLQLLAAFTAFAFVSSITPGPNNLMLMASGANFGVRRSLPHLFGVGFGFMIMVLLVGVGLQGVFDAFPFSYVVLKWVSVVYLCYLAWRIARAGDRAGSGARAAAPMSFLQAALFQWVNPKGWAMALTAVAVYAPDRSIGAVLLVAGLFGVINLPSVGSWMLLGRSLGGFLGEQQRMRAFNVGMAALLVLSVGTVVLV